jgi:Flp pilus assembly protein TadG
MTLRSIISNQRGSNLVEFAIVTPILLLAVSGAADFGRLFLNAIAIKSGSAVGAIYGSQTFSRSGDIAAIEQLAANEAVDAARAADLSVTAEQVCVCPGSTAFACGDYQDVSCAGYGDGSARAYIRVEVEQIFKPIAPFSGTPSSTPIRQSAWMRVR